MHHIAVKLLPKLKLYEFYVIDVKTEVEKFALAVEANSNEATKIVEPSGGSEYDLLESFINNCLPPSWNVFALSTRFAPLVNIPAALDLVITKVGSNSDKLDALRVFKRLLETVNLPRYRLFDEDIAAILENTKSRIRFTRLDDDGPKMGEITESFVFINHSAPPVRNEFCLRVLSDPVNRSYLPTSLIYPKCRRNQILLFHWQTTDGFGPLILYTISPRPRRPEPISDEIL